MIQVQVAYSLSDLRFAALFMLEYQGHFLPTSIHCDDLKIYSQSVRLGVCTHREVEVYLEWSCVHY